MEKRCAFCSLALPRWPLTPPHELTQINTTNQSIEPHQPQTHIKFIHEPNSSPAAGAFDVPANKNCEAKAREAFKGAAHGTPGVDHTGGYASSCPEYDVEDHMKPLQAIASSS